MRSCGVETSRFRREDCQTVVTPGRRSGHDSRGARRSRALSRTQAEDARCGARGSGGRAVRGTGDSRDSERGDRGAECKAATRRAGELGEGEGAWPTGPRPTWRLQLGRVRATLAQSATRRVARPQQDRERQTPTPTATGAQPRSGPDNPCENSPTKARASLELPVSASLFRTLSLVFLSERPIEFWGLWFCSVKSAPWKTGKFLAQN